VGNEPQAESLRLEDEQRWCLARLRRVFLRNLGILLSRRQKISTALQVSLQKHAVPSKMRSGKTAFSDDKIAAMPANAVRCRSTHCRTFPACCLDALAQPCPALSQDAALTFTLPLHPPVFLGCSAHTHSVPMIPVTPTKHECSRLT